MGIVKTFYRKSLGDIDLTLMIETALVEYANQKLEEAANSVTMSPWTSNEYYVDTIRSFKEPLK